MPVIVLLYLNLTTMHDILRPENKSVGLQWTRGICYFKFYKYSNLRKLHYFPRSVTSHRLSRWPRCLRRTSGVAGSNLAGGKNVRLLCLLRVGEGSGLCDGLTIRPVESYRLYVRVSVCDLETSTMSGRMSEFFLT